MLDSKKQIVHISPSKTAKNTILTSRLYEFARLQCKKLYIVKMYKFRGGYKNVSAT